MSKKQIVIEPPPKDSHINTYRVVYSIDISATTSHSAAHETYQIMQDTNSIPPHSEIIDSDGNITEIDLSKNGGED